MSTELARRALARAGVILHAHHSHGHEPYPSHDPPRLEHGGWMPPGTGPFRPGPGAPTFGAALPTVCRPGVTTGSSQRWAGVVGGAPSFGAATPASATAAQQQAILKNAPVKLTSSQVAELRSLMLAALPKTGAGAPGQKPQWDIKTLQMQLAAAKKQHSLFDQARGAAVESERQALMTQYRTAPAQKQALQSAANALANLWGGGGGGSPGGGGADLSASLDAGINVQPPSISIPTPSASASASFHT